MDFDLRLLRHCRALAEEGSFARAARALHITQPALSRSIRDLEDRVGIQVFDRTRTRVVPTDLGRAFLDRAGELLSHAETLHREIALIKGSVTGVLNVGAGTFPSVLFMGHALAAFLAEHPGAELRVTADHWANLVAMLRRRELDLVVAAPPSEADAADLEVTVLTRRQGFFFVRPGHPLAGRDPVELRDIAAYPIATTARIGAAMSELVRKARGDRPVKGSVPDFGCESFAILKAVVCSNDHVLLATLSIVADELRRKELVALPFTEPVIGSVFAILRLRNRTLPTVAEHLISAIVAADRLTFEADRLHEMQWLRKQHGSALPKAVARRAHERGVTQR